MNICFYGASSDSISENFKKQTEDLARLLAQNGHTLCFGGGATGSMGAAARGFQKEHGTIIGVAPSFFNVDGILFENATEMIYTKTMRERKEYLEKHSDAYLVAPGGIGTMDEFFEIYTLKTLNLLPGKPLVLFNVDGCYDALLSLLGYFVTAHFMPEENLSSLKIAHTVDEAYSYLTAIEA